MRRVAILIALLVAAIPLLLRAQSNMGPGTPPQTIIVSSNTTTDLFNRASLGSNWNVGVGGFTTATNGPLTGTNAASANIAQYVANGQPVTSDILTLNSNTGSGYSGPASRITCSAGVCSGYACTANSTTLFIFKFVNQNAAGGGTLTIYNGGGAGTAVTSTIADTIELKTTGNGAGGSAVVIQCYWNRTGQSLEVADASSPLTSGYDGVYINLNANSMASWASTRNAPATALYNIVLMGDSTGNGAATYDYWSTFLTTSHPNAYVTNIAVSGQALNSALAAGTSGTLNTMLTDETNVAGVLVIPGASNILLLQGGSNDVANCSTPPCSAAQLAPIEAAINTFVSAGHTLGYKYVIVNPVLSRCDVATTDVSVSNLNVYINQNSAGADAVAPWPQSLVGKGACNQTTVFSSDHVHPILPAIKDLIAPFESVTIANLTH